MYNNFELRDSENNSIYVTIKAKQGSKNEKLLTDLFYTNTYIKSIWLDSTKEYNKKYHKISLQKFADLLEYDWLLSGTIYFNNN